MPRVGPGAALTNSLLPNLLWLGLVVMRHLYSSPSGFHPGIFPSKAYFVFFLEIIFSCISMELLGFCWVAELLCCVLLRFLRALFHENYKHCVAFGALILVKTLYFKLRMITGVKQESNLVLEESWYVLGDCWRGRAWAAMASSVGFDSRYRRKFFWVPYLLFTPFRWNPSSGILRWNTTHTS